MIYYIIGVRRSGIHAIANWLFPMMGEYIYLNNYELGKLTDYEMVVNGKFNVIIGIENKEVSEILKYCHKGKRIWVTRRWHDVRKSQIAHYHKAGLDEVQTNRKVSDSLSLYLDYLNVTDYKIDFDRWNSEQYYRTKVAAELGLQFDDSNKNIVFGYGKSSFA